MRNLPVWLYWEGERPPWIEACLETVFAHAPTARLLDPPSFDALRNSGRDIDLGRLHVVQRSDYIRAFLLAHYGGLWLDADCVVLHPLAPLLEELERHDFLYFRNHFGDFASPLIAAPPGSRVAAAFHARVAAILRRGGELSWTEIGQDSLLEVLRGASAPLCEIARDRVMPICWSDQARFFALGTPAEHERSLLPETITYMLSHQGVRDYQATHPGADLLDERTFFSFLVRRALGRS